MTTDSIRLTDLAKPQFCPEIIAIRSVMTGMADDLDFDPDAMRAKAIAEVELEDFGGEDYVEPFVILAGAVDHSKIISPVGRFMMHAQLMQLLKNRLLLADLLTRHPEIHDIEIVRPIIICGLPRTGTTHLHNLMAADPALRSLPYWESLEPIPLPAEADVEPDPRLERCEMGLEFVNQAMPEFNRMHEMTTWHVHEEIQLLAMDFSTMYFESIALLPEWRDYYLNHDQTPHYRYMKTALKALQFLRGGNRWVLKSPQHLEQFSPLLDTFRDAIFVVTHREPVAVVTSMATMAAYTARMYHDPVDPKLFGRYWADRLEKMLGASVRDREKLPAEQSIDVRFGDFMADDIAMVHRIYDLADQPFTQQIGEAMSRYMAEHPQGRFGRVDYRSEDVGLDKDDLMERFAFYADRFLKD
ncbi:sulfotransferase [Chloroflexota bacterium]